MASTNNSNSDLKSIRHSAEHVLTQAMQNLYPNKFLMAMGPAIDNGFYFDFETINNFKISENDFPKIEAEMAKIIKENLPITKKEITINEAKKIFKDNSYKIEWLDQIKNRKEPISIYWTGDEFVDLCAGPHVRYTKQIKAFKLLSIAGAYWHGDEKNKMLTRIYGTAFNSKQALQKHLDNIEEAKKRDHRKLGKELDLFCFSDLVGPGLPLFTPKGTIVKEELQKHVENICRTYGFQKVSTPHLAKIELYEISGHAKKFGEELFHVTSSRNHDFVLKPVQCPHQTQIYASKLRSYRDLPIRYMESEKQYRAEKGGEVGGLNRVYAITCEDGHSFCRIDQVKNEIINMVNIIKNFYSALGLWKDNWISLSVRDYAHPEKYIGEPKDWDICEKMLEEVSNEMELKAIKREGEAALYGPKLDFMFKDALGNEIQIPTVQLDFATPKKFNLSYTDNKGKEQVPVMVHRAILGSYERFMALIIEHFAGAFPTWLAPVQVKIIPITDEQLKYAQKVEQTLKESDIRVEIDNKSETMQNKIRTATGEKIPYMIIIGGREVENNTVSIRQRDGQDLGTMPLSDFIKKIKNQITKKNLNLIK
jgi:threonyl-tRNA synthetase